MVAAPCRLWGLSRLWQGSGSGGLSCEDMPPTTGCACCVKVFRGEVVRGIQVSG